MNKSIIKEIIIMLLLLLAIILVLAILFYDYIPTSKVIPEIETYQTEESISKELQDDLQAETSQVVKTYEVDATDLQVYEQAKDYKKGKVNPFSSYNTNTVANNANSQTQAGAGQTTTEGKNTTTSENTNKNTTVNNTVSVNDTSSEDEDFYPNKGTK